MHRLKNATPSNRKAHERRCWRLPDALVTPSQLAMPSGVKAFFQMAHRM
jgi:hypothetical protein